MNRKHSSKQYIEIIEKIRNVNPDIALSGDFIVGFPGETQTDFIDTLELVKNVGYAQSYSFKYSSRPGTPASVLESQVPENIKKTRLRELQNLLFSQQRQFNSQFLDREVEVLIEKYGERNSQVMGRSAHMQAVYMDQSLGAIGDIKKVKISCVGQNSLKV